MRLADRESWRQVGEGFCVVTQGQDDEKAGGCLWLKESQGNRRARAPVQDEMSGGSVWIIVEQRTEELNVICDQRVRMKGKREVVNGW